MLCLPNMGMVVWLRKTSEINDGEDFVRNFSTLSERRWSQTSTATEWIASGDLLAVLGHLSMFKLIREFLNVHLKNVVVKKWKIEKCRKINFPERLQL